MKKVLTIVLAVSVLAGCASGLNSVQEREYASMKREGVLIEEKNPSTGFAWGFAPGGGSFYARSPGLGVLNLLMWPLSIFWDPVSGEDGSKVINYDLTKHELRKKEQKQLSELDDKLATKKITNEEYIRDKNSIQSKYIFD